MKDKAEAIVLNNLALLKGERRRQSEQMLYELSELSRLIAQDIKKGKISLKTPYDFVDGVRHLSEESPISEDALADYVPFLEQENTREHLASVAALSVFLAERKPSRFVPFSLCEIPQQVRVAYIPSPMAENAFERLSQARSDLSVLYVSGAEEACAAVSASNAEYALLPLATPEGMRLSAIEKLTERYKLYLCAVLPIGNDGMDETLYGAFASTPAPLNNTPISHTELRLTCESHQYITELLSCLSVFHFELVQVNIAPVGYGRVSARTVLRGNGDLGALWFFFALTAGDFEILGRYAYL